MEAFLASDDEDAHEAKRAAGAGETAAIERKHAAEGPAADGRRSSKAKRSRGERQGRQI